MAQTTPVTSDVPLALPYRDAPTGDVVASEAALRALAKARPWALACAVGMFLYALVGGGFGTVWLVVTIMRAGDPTFPLEKFAKLIPPNLVGAPLALVGGVLAVRFHAAAGRARARRSTLDLERALAAQLHIWRWASVTMIALFAMPAIIAVFGRIMGAW